MITIAAAQNWQPYLLPSFKSRPTSSVLGFAPAPKATSDKLSSATREPKLFALHIQIDQLAALSNNWDGHGSVRADSLSVANAHQFLEEAYQQSGATAGWQKPYICASEDGEIVFEWWNGNRKLTIYVEPQQTTYIRSRGPHVLDDMEDGVLPEDGISSLWAWLFE